MTRPLGSWTWCRYCKHYSGFYCYVWNVISSETGNPYGAEVGRVKFANACAPRLTLTGRIRRLVGLPIGEGEK